MSSVEGSVTQRGPSAALCLIFPRHCSADNAGCRGTSDDVKPSISAASETQDVMPLTQQYVFWRRYKKKTYETANVFLRFKYVLTAPQFLCIRGPQMQVSAMNKAAVDATT